jgi:hypothetical protein
MEERIDASSFAESSQCSFCNVAIAESNQNE